MNKRQIIAALMLSPFYFSLTLRQRQELAACLCRLNPALTLIRPTACSE